MPDASGVPSIVSETDAPPWSVPKMTGVRVAMKEPDTGEMMTGALGAEVLTVNVTAFDAGPVPMPLVAVAVMVYVPSASGALGEQDQAPVVESAVAVQTTAPVEVVTVTVEPGSAVPTMVG
jgi:hypothetical protein